MFVSCSDFGLHCFIVVIDRGSLSANDSAAAYQNDKYYTCVCRIQKGIFISLFNSSLEMNSLMLSWNKYRQELRNN
jgi:hypothetical protein